MQPTEDLSLGDFKLPKKLARGMVLHEKRSFLEKLVQTSRQARQHFFQEFVK